MNYRTRLLVTLLVFSISTSAFSAEPQDAAREFVYKKTPQGELKIHLHYPQGWQPSDRRPAIVFFFGGGWRRGKIEQFTPQAKYLASRGMVAARADYRVKNRHGVTPDVCVQDAKSAVRWLRKNAGELGVDPNRLVASGGSAGGHIAACTALVAGLEAEDEDQSISSKPNALVLYNPALNLVGFARFLELHPGTEKIIKQISPTYYLKKESPPTLILIGTEDHILPQIEEFQAKAKTLGHATEVYIGQGAKHGFFNREPWYSRTLFRTDEYLKSLGYVEGVPTLEVQ